MSFFGSPAENFSQELHELTQHDLVRLITHEHVPTLSDAQAGQIQAAILTGRTGDRISLRKIFELLEHMTLTYEISKFDRDGVMKVMENFFNTHGLHS